MSTVQSIYRYPVKGLAGQRLDSVSLTPGEAIPMDRAFAIKHGQTVFDPDNPVYMSKTKFLALMTHAELAAFKAGFSDDGTRMTLTRGGDVVFDGNLTDAADAAELETLMATHVGDRAKGAPKLVSAEGHMFSDVPEKCLSVLNLASVKALSDKVGVALDPLRFRANLHLDGLPAWAERDWQDGELFKAGDTMLRVMSQITRCNATNVNLETAEVDQNLPKTLMKQFSANLMGVYFLVEQGGIIKTGAEFLEMT